jgi:hypothetical protein
MRDDAQQRATEFLKELYAAGDIDARRFETSVAGLLDVTTNIGRVRLRHPGPRDRKRR